MADTHTALGPSQISFSKRPVDGSFLGPRVSRDMSTQLLGRLKTITKNRFCVIQPLKIICDMIHTSILHLPTTKKNNKKNVVSP